MSESESLQIDFHQGVLNLIIYRPKVNALNLELIAALQSAFQRALRDEQVRCVTLTGSGGVFSAGQDITAFLQEEDIPIRYHLLRTYNPLIMQMRHLEKPILAAINGMVSGAALGLALACDLRIASDTARFVVGFNGIGLAPDSGVSLLLPALIGLGRASEATFCNTPISAQQALEWGMVNRLASADDLPAQTAAWAEELARGPLRAFGLTKRAFNKAVLPNLEQALDYEAHIQEIAGKSQEHREGVRAFLEKRPPKFLDI